jgi:predicted component of type VI protein secretion system
VPNLLKVRLSLKGRPIRSYLFDKPKVSIGRDPNADICLDNTGISRDHAVIERTAGGYVIADLGSANGTFLNERPVRREYLSSDDVVHIGKFALWMDIEPDRRERHLLEGRTSPSALEGTMVLDPDTLLDMQRKSMVERDELEDAGFPEPGPGAPARGRPRRRGVAPVVVAFLVGAASGWAVALLVRG